MEKEQTLTVFHTGFAKVRKPDLAAGRSNADFGQGFYLSDDKAFAGRWAKERIGSVCYLNVYRLSLDGLTVKRFRRDASWYDYIFTNRAGRPDLLSGYDVVIGPIAPDTIFDTWGILTSGMIDRKLALSAYRLVPAYRQIVLKSERALCGLEFLGVREIPGEEITRNKVLLRQEEQAYQKKLFRLLDSVQDPEEYR